MRSYSIFLFLLIISCTDDGYEQYYPHSFPLIEYPEDNKPTASRVELGRRLFFDPILSKDSSIACASCHIPEFAFADTVAISSGVNGPSGKRNSYSILNVAYQKALFMEGGVPNLELQALAPLGESSEQQILISDAAKRLKKNKEYQKLAHRAYNRDIDPYVITRAIAAYERTLLSANSRYDAYHAGNENALTTLEKKGMELFYGKANCSSCHSGFLFTNQEFENIGLYANYNDVGRMRLTNDSSDFGKFKVPSLRNVSKTAPYMHDGSVATLSETIEHFNSGGKPQKNLSLKIKPLDLNVDEKESLLAFLIALEDTIVVGENKFKN